MRVLRRHDLGSRKRESFHRRLSQLLRDEELLPPPKSMEEQMEEIFEKLKENDPDISWAGFMKMTQEDIKRRLGKEEAEKRQKERENIYENYHLTSRRIVSFFPSVAPEQKEKTNEIRGPRLTAPRNQQDAFREISKRNPNINAFLEKDGRIYAIQTFPVRDSREILPALIQRAIENTWWSVGMRFGYDDLVWVRPLISVLAVFGEKTLEGGVSLGKHKHARFLTFTNKIQEARDSEAFPAEGLDDSVGGLDDSVGGLDDSVGGLDDSVKGLDDYASQLQEHGIDIAVIDGHERRLKKLDEVEQAREQLIKNRGYDPNRTSAWRESLPETAFLLEGVIAPRFSTLSDGQNLPEEIRLEVFDTQRALVKSRQKSGESKANPEHTPSEKEKKGIDFLVFSEKPDPKGTIINGYQRVIGARLLDACFFYEKDSQRTLDEMGSQADTILFHPELGTLGEKRERVDQLLAYLGENSETTNKKSIDLARIANKKARADLVSLTVGEMPALQGWFGALRAQTEGHADETCHAMRHFHDSKPAGEASEGLVLRLLHIADRIDTLVGMKMAGESASSSRDPFALRRATDTVGLAFCVSWRNLRFDMRTFLEESVRLYQKSPRSRGEIDSWLKELNRPLGASIVNHFREECQSVLKEAEERLSPSDWKSISDWEAVERAQERMEGFVCSRYEESIGRGKRFDLALLAETMHGFYSFCEKATDSAETRAQLESIASTLRRIHNILLRQKNKFFIEASVEAGGGTRFYEHADVPNLDPALFTHDEEKRLYELASELRDFEGLHAICGPVAQFFETVTVISEDDSLKGNRLALLHRLYDRATAPYGKAVTHCGTQGGATHL